MSDEERKVKAVIAAEIIKILESYNCNVDESKEILDYTLLRIENKDKVNKAWKGISWQLQLSAFNLKFFKKMVLHTTEVLKIKGGGSWSVDLL